MFYSLAICLEFFVSWVNAAAYLQSIGGVHRHPIVLAHQKVLGAGGTYLNHDGLAVITAAPKFPLVKRQANPFIGYVTDPNGCKYSG
jgi:hypothetical protein